jgi:hypothetical protein
MVPDRQRRDVLFAPGTPGAALVKAGFTVWAPDNVYHEEIMRFFPEHDFSLMWGKVSILTWPFIKERVPKNKGKIVIGIAAGGLTGLAMAITDSTITGVITSGAYFPLELTRRDYRIKGHPFCHDFRNFASYLPLYALLIGKPLQIQMGKNDGLWIGKPLPRIEGFFSGTKRGSFTDEVLGGIKLLTELNQKTKGNFSFILHEKGHTDIDISAAINFLEKLKSHPQTHF